MDSSIEFFSKVYDKYIETDYEVTDTDLNPKREVDDNFGRIYKKIQKDYEDIRLALDTYEKQAKKADFKDKVYSNDNGLDYDTLNALENANSRRYCGGDLFNIDIQGLDALIDDVRSSLTEVSVKLLETGENYSSSLDKTLSDLSILLQLNCKSYENFDDILKGLTETSDIFDNTLEGFDDLLEAYFSWNKVGDVSEGILQGDRNRREVLANLKLKAKMPAESDFLHCAEASLAILMVILVLLKIIMILSMILSIAMNILVMATATLSKITQCWVNPPSVADCISYISDIILGLLKQVMAALLDTLWHMLELACGSSAFKSTLDNVKDSITAIRTGIATGKQLVMNVNSTPEKFEKLAAELDFSAQWEKARVNYTKEVEKICSTWENVQEDWYGYEPPKDGETLEEEEARKKRILEKAKAKWIQYGKEAFNMSNAGQAIYDLTDPDNKMTTQVANAAMDEIAKAESDINKEIVKVFNSIDDEVTAIDTHSIEYAQDFFEGVKISL